MDHPKYTNTNVASDIAATMPRLVLPEEPAITPDELARRRQLYAEAQALREEIGPIGIPADELIHQVREEADTDCGG